MYMYIVKLFLINAVYNTSDINMLILLFLVRTERELDSPKYKYIRPLCYTDQFLVFALLFVI